MRLTDGIELRDEPVDGAARGRSGASAGKEGQPRGIERVDPRQLFCHLHGKRGASFGELRQPHDAPPDGLAVQAIHEERVVPRQIGQEPVRPRSLDARAVRLRDERVLVFEGKRVLVDAAARGAAEHERERSRRRAELHRPRLHRGAAGKKRELRDLHGPAEQRGEPRFQRLSQLLAHRCHPMMWN